MGVVLMATPTPTPPFRLLTEIDLTKFDALTPSQFLIVKVANSLTNRRWLRSPTLRLAILDHPFDNDKPVKSAITLAIVVPRDREGDWNYCTEAGHFQLLFNNHGVSRLILIGNPPLQKTPSFYKSPDPDMVSDELEKLERELQLPLQPFHPVGPKLYETIIHTIEDDVVFSVTVENYESPNLGEFLVEDIELVGGDLRDDKLRRRLRYKQMPNVIKSEALLLPIFPDDEATTQTDLESLRGIEGATFTVNTRVLVQQHMISMIAALFLVAPYLSHRIQQDLDLRALCLGVGGGVLLSFLETVLGFHVTGVEKDEMILNESRKHFEFNKSESIQLIVGDAIEIVQNFPSSKPDDEVKVDDDKVVPGVKFDVVFVDLDSSEAKLVYTAPPPEFVKKPVFQGLRSLLDDHHGAVIVKVVPNLNELFNRTLVKELKENFHKVFKINAGNQDWSVVIAIVPSTSLDDDDSDNVFLTRLKAAIPGAKMRKKEL